MTDDVTEARVIIEALIPLRERMRRCDRAFLQSWRIHLARHRDKVRVGRFRLHNLRLVAETYGVQVERLVEIEVSSGYWDYFKEVS